MIFLPLSFFITALLYAAVGFGGGSTYSALLILAEIDFRILPIIALLCNLIVVTGGTYRFYRSGHINIKRITPWVITSVPAALLGGYINISETLFIGILGISLFLAGIRMLLQKKELLNTRKILLRKSIPPIIGMVLGLLSGIVGIGGGIFLAPILYFFKWDNAQKISATCSIFILVNSLSGLVGHFIKLNGTERLSDINLYWFIFPAVFIGGQIGSYLGTEKLNSKVIHLMTAVLILYVSARLIFRWWGMVIT